MSAFAAALFFGALAWGAPYASAQLDPAARERIAALSSAGDGEAVTETLLRRHEGTGPQARAEKAALIAASIEAMPYLDESVRHAPDIDPPMGIDGPTCFNAAPKLGMMLRAEGFPVLTVATAGHVFLIARYPDATFIVDPTIRQFLGQDAAPDWVPRIFVGGVSELAALYQKDPGLPVMPYRQIYFNPEWPSAVADSKMIGRRDRFLWSPMSAEHAPLTRYFNAAERRRRLRAQRDSLRAAPMPFPVRFDGQSPRNLR